MTVRNRLLLTIAASIVGVLCISIGTISRPMDEAFQRLHRQTSREQLTRISEAFRLVNKAQFERTVDWAAWDDSYAFMKDRNQEFVRINMSEDIVGTMKLDVVGFVHLDGKWLQASTPRRFGGKAPLDLTSLAMSMQMSRIVRIPEVKKNGISGYVKSDGELVSVSLKPVVNSDQTAPARGYIIFARRYGPDFEEMITDVTRQRPLLRDLNDPDISTSLRETLTSHGMVAPNLKDASRNGYVTISNLNKQPIFAARVELDHRIADTGLSALAQLSWFLAGMGLLVGAATYFLVDRFVLRRLFVLRDQMRSIHSAEGARVSLPGTDEFGALAEAINITLGSLDHESSRLRDIQAELRSQNLSLNSALETVEFQANHDGLTGLANRSLFNRRLADALETARTNQSGVAVIYLDLDSFKLINDSLGHFCGDELLISVAQSLRECVREYDLVARFGGDEFVVLVNRVNRPADAIFVANRILERLSQPVTLEGREVFALGSLGIAISHDGTDRADDLLLRADNALRVAKGRGKGCFVLHEDSMDMHSVDRLELATLLRRAVARKEIQVAYQPLVDLADGSIVGAEALARWHDASRGNISPAEFIPLAEEVGLIGELGYNVMETACRAAIPWVKESDGKFVLSVNLSGRQLSQADVVDRVNGVLARTGFSPRNLQIELTESVLIDDSMHALDKIRELREIGISLALDDFGTGYSSLSTLHEYPIDCLKIDRSFISSIEKDVQGRAVVEAILSMARAMKIHVVAEGIELADHAQILVGLGCGGGQGYFYSRPVAPGEFSALLSAQSDELAA